MSKSRTPRQIQHGVFPGGSFGRIPSFAFAPVCRKLTDGERRLFLYYAMQAEKFAPSFKEIYKNTGMEASNANRIRKRLTKKGFIRDVVNGDECAPIIAIQWDYIREVARQIAAEDKEEQQKV